MDEDKNINAENVDVINPTLYGYDGLKEIAGSALCYFFAKNVSLKNIQNAWIALIGISGDTLMRIDDWKSFNLEVLEDALNEEQIIIEEGVCTSGASHDLLKNVLASLSIEQQKTHPRLSESQIRRLHQKAPEEIKRALQVFGYYQVKIDGQLIK